MTILSVAFIQSFEAELVKQAAIPFDVLRRAVGRAAPAAARSVRGLVGAARSPLAAELASGLAGGAGAGAVGGGLLGAAEGAYKGYQGAQEQGATVGEALTSGLGGALHQAGHRAVQGAALGGVAGAALTPHFKGLPAALAKAPVVGGGARFGERQLHGLTGWTPQEGLRSIRGGAWESGQRLEDAADRLRKAHSSGQGVAKAEKARDVAVRGHQASVEAEGRGLTSLPGYAKALRKDPIGALKAGFGQEWQGSTPAMRALTYGAAGLSAVQEVKDRPEGMGVAEGAGRAIGGALPWMAGPLTMTAGMALSPALAAAGGVVGKGLSALKPRRQMAPGAPAPGAAEISGGQATPTEHVYSDRAMGTIPEGVGG